MEQGGERGDENVSLRALVGLMVDRPHVDMKLTRFRGHPNICVQGAHDGEDETTLHT
jgi:hypothetical protein